MNEISIKEALSVGWKGFKKDVGMWVGLMITIFVVSMVVGSFSYSFDIETGQSSGTFAGNILGWVLNVFMTIGILTIAIKTVRGQKGSFGELFTACSSFQKFFNMFAVNVLMGIVVLIGFILLIIPGVIASMMLFLAPYYVAIENMGPIEAMKRSAESMKGYKMQLFLFILTSIGIIILGALAFGVGLLVAVPVVTIASAHIYERITKGQSESTDVAQGGESTPEPVIA